MSPSTVTPVRLTACSGTGASHTGLRVSRSIAATCESNEPAPDGDGDGLGRARARRRSRARPGRRVAEPLRVDQDPSARRCGDGRRHGRSVVPVDGPLLRPAPEVGGDDLRGADGDRDGPVADRLRETEVAVRAAEGNVEMPRFPIRRLGRIGERSRVARVALRLRPPADRLGGGRPEDEPASPDHHGGEDDRTREEAASTCGNEPGVAQSRAILGGARRSDARPVLRRRARAG